MHRVVHSILLSYLICFVGICFNVACSSSHIVQYERQFKATNYTLLGDRIAYYANSFIGTPYDRILIGLYVDSKRIIADNEVDCMYLVFRAVELGIANGDNKKALQIGLDKRFHNKGILDKNGFVKNYDNRFDYSEDMIASGKWGKSIFKKNEMATIKGTRMYKTFSYMPSEKIIDNEKLYLKFKSGDILFFVKDPKLRSKAQEIIGHLGIIDVVDGKVYVIHASGLKSYKQKQGKVKKVLLNDYLKQTKKFVGIYVTRL